MNYTLNLDEVDSDGAIREAAGEVSGDTRLSFLKKAGIAGGVVHCKQSPLRPRHRVGSVSAGQRAPTPSTRGAFDCSFSPSRRRAEDAKRERRARQLLRSEALCPALHSS
jgi:hypothetical protein